ncbi:MAG: sulfatase [Verrucomicrobiota bacterium JB024]|nr:sulfatase [Verrucomicrobiota bacterium JB024]
MPDKSPRPAPGFSIFLHALALTSVAALSLLVLPRADAAAPNVLFIAVDDLRNELGCYGDPEALTPNLDSLAATGMLFNRAYSQQALCNPSRVSLLTSRRPDTLRTWNLTRGFRFDKSVVTLPELFKDHGYYTQDIGKIYHNWREEGHADYPGSWSVPPTYHRGTHGQDKPLVDGPLPPDFSTDPRTECRDVPDTAYYDGRIAQEAIQALEGFAENPDQPFFLAVGFWKPHLPFNAPKRYWDLYDREKLSMPEPSLSDASIPQIALENGPEFSKNGPSGDKLTPEAVRELRHGYMACVSYLDAQVGKLLDELDRLGLSDNTIVVFWSDHGFHLGELGLWAKCTNFELDARVPLLIRVPGALTAGETTDAMVELLDLYPTLAELCNLPLPDGVEGVSLVPVLEDPASEVKPAAYTQHPRPAYYQGAVPEQMGYSVRVGDYRYTEWRDWTTGEVTAAELYDYSTDPDETVNRVDDPTLADALRECQARLYEYTPAPGKTL